jgi:hypothetical protein
MNRVPPDQPVKEARQRPQKQCESMNSGGTMEKYWAVEFQEAFLP